MSSLCLMPPFHWAMIRSRFKPIWRSGQIGNKRELNGGDPKLSGNERQWSGVVGKVGGDLWTCSKIAPNLIGSGTGLRSSVRSVSWSSLIVSWSYESGTQCLERVQNIIPIIPVVSILCPRLTYAVIKLCLRPTLTKADLRPINLRCAPTLPDSYKTRFGLFLLEQWECAGEATHKGSLKVNLVLLQGRRPLNIRGAPFKKSIPSSHPFRLSATYSTEDAPNCSADSAIFFICSAADLFDLFCSQCDQFSWVRSSIGIVVPEQSVAREWHAVSKYEPKTEHRILDPW